MSWNPISNFPRHHHCPNLLLFFPSCLLPLVCFFLHLSFIILFLSCTWPTLPHLFSLALTTTQQANLATSTAKVAQLLETHKAEVEALTATHVGALSEVKGQAEKQKEVTEKLRSEEESLKCSLKELEHRAEKLTVSYPCM